MRSRNGFTLVEVVVAMVLLGTVVLTMSAATTRMIRSATDSSRSTIALALVQDRLATIAADPGYAQLENRYEGTESGTASGVSYRRTTLITHNVQSQTGGRTIDFKRIAVTVEETNSNHEVTRSITVGAP